MSTDLVIIERPLLPDHWDYDESVEKVRQVIYKWKTLETEAARELWIARKKLSREGRPPKTGTKVPVSWNQYCKDIGSSKQVVNRWLARWFPSIELKRAAQILPDRIYNVILADPPWRYEHPISNSRRIENQYPTMSLEEICALQVPAVEDSLLFLWATNPKLEEALQVMNAWGFKYRTNGVWVKDKIGMGYYFRSQHELLLVGRKGKIPMPEEANRPSSVLEAPRTGHSVKPGEIHGLIEKMYPRAKRIELFARQKREGWDSWGNEA